MLQPTEAQHVAEAAQHAGEAAASGKFNAGETIIGQTAAILPASISRLVIRRPWPK